MCDSKLYRQLPKIEKNPKAAKFIDLLLTIVQYVMKKWYNNRIKKKKN